MALLRENDLQLKAFYASSPPCMWKEYYDWIHHIFKLQVSFHQKATNHMALLPKMTCKDKTPYASSPPCTTFSGELSFANVSGELTFVKLIFYQIPLQGGVESQDAWSLLVIFRKRALWFVALLPKMTCNLRHPMGLRHPVLSNAYHSRVMK